MWHRYPSGVAVTVQSSVLGLGINGVAHRGGLVNFMPVESSSVIQILRRIAPSLSTSGSQDSDVASAAAGGGFSGYMHGEAILLMPENAFCERVEATEAMCGFNTTGSGALVSNDSSGVVLWGPLPCALNATQAYQVCYRPANTSAFESTGVAVHLQEDVAGLEINDVAAGDGHRLTAAKSPHNHMCLRLSRTFLSRGNTSSQSFAVSLIPAHLDCRLAADNPAQFTNASSAGDVFSGHLPLGVADRCMCLCGYVCVYVRAHALVAFAATSSESTCF
jgi:hypothetical protein